MDIQSIPVLLVYTASTISQHLQQLPSILCNTIGHCHFSLDTSDLVEEFNSETLVLASDGSVLMDDATQAWILYGTHTDTRAYGHGPVPGGDSLSPLYVLKLVDMLEVCWPLMQSCQQPTMYHMHQTKS